MVDAGLSTVHVECRAWGINFVPQLVVSVGGAIVYLRKQHDEKVLESKFSQALGICSQASKKKEKKRFETLLRNN